jgi:hypothetical protein
MINIAKTFHLLIFTRILNEKIERLFDKHFEFLAVGADRKPYDIQDLTAMLAFPFCDILHTDHIF